MTIPEAEQSLQDYRDTLRIAGVVRWAEELVKREKGAEAYLVGGAVRDRILGRPDTEDYDFVNQAAFLGRPPAMLAIHDGMHPVLIGRQHIDGAPESAA